MTTIAASLDFMEMAADSMCSGDDSFYMVDKLRMGKESIYGACGNWDACLKFLSAIEQGKNELDSDLDVSVLELREDGLWVYESTIIPARIKNRFWAIGTGANYAIACMDMGLSPAEAVAMACKYDSASNPPIDVFKLEGRRSGSKTSSKRNNRGGV